MKKENKKIKNAINCTIDSITFKSKLEKSFYKTLKDQGFNVQYEPKTHILWDGFSPVTPFYDEETPKEKIKRIASGDIIPYKKLSLRKGKVIGIRYTPDFYFKYKDLDVYIEAKGTENDVFYIKKKLFRKYLDNILETTGQKSIYFEVYTKKQLLQAIQIIKSTTNSYE